MSLRRRLTTAFVLCALLAAGCFSLLGIAFVYTVEDRFFERMLEDEARGIATPLRPHVRFYRSTTDMPRDLAAQLAPRAKGGEYFGEQGRHYHLRRTGDAWMVAEVSSQLVVRPRLPSILTMLGGMALVLAVVIGGAGYLFVRRATAPLARLGRMLEGTEHGRIPHGFSQQVPDDEIGALARALDTAMERIGEFILREQHFSRDASHELRTPIAVIDGAAALLEAERLTVEGRSQLRRIREACALMQRTTETLLALSREQGIAGEVEDLPLLPLVESAVVRAAYLLEGKDVAVRVDIGADATFRANRAVLEILLANLIGNAFSHTEAGAVDIRMDAGALTVENTAALPPGLASTMFTPGVKSAASRGAGLGLSIAQRLASVHSLHLSVTPGDTSVIAKMTNDTPMSATKVQTRRVLDH